MENRYKTTCKMGNKGKGDGKPQVEAKRGTVQPKKGNRKRLKVEKKITSVSAGLAQTTNRIFWGCWGQQQKKKRGTPWGGKKEKKERRTTRVQGTKKKGG